uniref:Uncharacterized protein n=1 Tax=Haptolina brevifila TaxID=156173 RepID=A0A7S2H0X7_9EUKA|mmetsp:Transcript_49952/g.99467  ORF Transcript_49952/g.99467 Transcript_49952/m.99467 type:complete len:169 (+) Transcript_49952:1073-1579(+)
MVASVAMLTGLIGISSIISIISAEMQALRLNRGSLAANRMQAGLPIARVMPTTSTSTSTTHGASSAHGAEVLEPLSMSQPFGMALHVPSSQPTEAQLDDALSDAAALERQVEQLSEVLLRRRQQCPHVAECLKALHESALATLSSFEKVAATPPPAPPLVSTLDDAPL